MFLYNQAKIVNSRHFGTWRFMKTILLNGMNITVGISHHTVVIKHCIAFPVKKFARVLSLTFDFQNIGRKKQRQQNHLFHQHFIPWGHNGLQRPILFLDKFPKQSSHYKYYWHVL